MAPINDTHELLVEQLRDLYDAEKQLLEAMPRMHAQATDEDLKEAFEEHLEETRHQAERLEKAFDHLGTGPLRKTCKGMQGILQEAQDEIDDAGILEVRDLAIIAQAHRIEHYEIAGYTMAVQLAERLDLDEVVDLLEENLAEEEETAEMLEDFVDESMWERLKESMGVESART